ncbi:hypothetical protein FHG87_024758 [Trinorchestia longiramus]|nr:hypothetical protein FHG87_024758 [Trinorchestia longiramus]
MGAGVMQTKNEVLLEQSAYTKALLSRFGMDKANSVATPVDVNADLVTTSGEVDYCDRLIPKYCRVGMMVSSIRRSWDVSMVLPVEVLPISASSRHETRNSSYSLPGFEPARSLSAQAETRYTGRIPLDYGGCDGNYAMEKTI